MVRGVSANASSQPAQVDRSAPQPRARLSAPALVDLLDRAGRGEPRAWRELVDEFSGLAWAITRAHRLSDADAADVTQATFARLVENLDRLRDPLSVGAWLATTARRECFAVLRQQTRVLPVGDDMPDALDAGAPSHDAALIARERDEALWHAFERLSSRDQALLRMLIADPTPSYEEISAALQMPIGSLGPTRARALERLRGHARDLDVLDDPEEPQA
jgi:RNA polymerase sigma factor (sigma-70 family)